MSMKPILFNAEMVKAILDGRKTQTRRVVKVERLQDIDCASALAEGCDGRCDCQSNGAEGVLSCIPKDFSIERFQTVWDATIPKHPNKFKRYPYYWNDNPWVWVISFERCEKPKEWDNVQQSK